MQGMQTLLAICTAAQQREFFQPLHSCNGLDIVIVEISDAMDALSRHPYHALLIDLSVAANPGFALLEKLLAAELSGELTLPRLLFACIDDKQAETESILRLKGFDHILSPPLSETQLCNAFQLATSAQTELRELHALANNQPLIIDAMIPKLLQALAADIQQLDIIARAGTLIQIADIAHRMKSSWYLLGIPQAIRCCIVMERLPQLMDEGATNQQRILKMRQRFILLMVKYYNQLTCLSGRLDVNASGFEH